MKLPHTEVKFYPEVKSQTGLSSLRVACKRALSFYRVFCYTLEIFYKFIKFLVFSFEVKIGVIFFGRKTNFINEKSYPVYYSSFFQLHSFYQ